MSSLADSKLKGAFTLLVLLLASSFVFACTAKITIRDNSWAIMPGFDTTDMVCDSTCTNCYIDGVSGSDIYGKIDYSGLDSGGSGQEFWHQMGANKLRNKSFLTYYKLSLYDTHESVAVNGATVTFLGEPGTAYPQNLAQYKLQALERNIIS